MRANAVYRVHLREDQAELFFKSLAGAFGFLVSVSGEGSRAKVLLVPYGEALG